MSAAVASVRQLLLMINRSMSLSACMSPRAAEPKRMIRSGAAVLTILRTSALRRCGSGVPLVGVITERPYEVYVRGCTEVGQLVEDRHGARRLSAWRAGFPRSAESVSRLAIVEPVRESSLAAARRGRRVQGELCHCRKRSATRNSAGGTRRRCGLCFTRPIRPIPDPLLPAVGVDAKRRLAVSGRTCCRRPRRRLGGSAGPSRLTSAGKDRRGRTGCRGPGQRRGRRRACRCRARAHRAWC